MLKKPSYGTVVNLPEPPTQKISVEIRDQVTVKDTCHESHTIKYYSGEGIFQCILCNQLDSNVGWGELALPCVMDDHVPANITRGLIDDINALIEHEIGDEASKLQDTLRNNIYKHFGEKFK